MPNDGMSDDSMWDPTLDAPTAYQKITYSNDDPRLGLPLHSTDTETWTREEFKSRSIDVMTAVLMWSFVLAIAIFLLGGAVKLMLTVFF